MYAILGELLSGGLKAGGLLSGGLMSGGQKSAHHAFTCISIVCVKYRAYYGHVGLGTFAIANFYTLDTFADITAVR